MASALTIGAAAAAQKARAPLPTHAIRGEVKSINMFYLVIVTGSGKKARDMTFELNPATERHGDITIGKTVSVRYRVENHNLISTAVSANPDEASKKEKPRSAAQASSQ
jgi:hypothetical protein